MRIHHVTIPAHDTTHVANVLAEIFGARVIPLPHPTGTLLVYSGDSDGTALEIWPAGSRASWGDPDLQLTDLPLPERWPHHAYVTGDAVDIDRVLAIFAREGWVGERVRNGPPGAGFSLVRGLIENHTAIEIGGRELRQEYERFFGEIVRRANG